MTPFAMGLVVLVELIGAACLLHLWRRRDGGVLRRLGWSVVVLVPLLGPLLYGSIYRPLPPHGEPIEMNQYTRTGGHHDVTPGH